MIEKVTTEYEISGDKVVRISLTIGGPGKRITPMVAHEQLEIALADVWLDVLTHIEKDQAHDEHNVGDSK